MRTHPAFSSLFAMDKHNDEFEFERWADLARDDPQGFESARRKVLESLIESAPPERKQRLSGLQWQIDRERERAGTPMAACLKLSSMMWDKVLGAGGLVEGLEQLSGDRPVPLAPREAAAVLPFKRPPAEH